MVTFQPRPKQRQVLAYTGGRMGVSAVPGSGKTWTLSLLAAKLIAEGDLEDDQEVLVVTLVNSAVSNFAGRVARFVQERGLLPHVGYRVRTLHGLCARHRARASGAWRACPTISRSSTSGRRRRSCKRPSTPGCAPIPQSLDDVLRGRLRGQRADWLRRDRWPAYVITIAASFIKQAKDLQLTPADLRYRLDSFPEPTYRFWRWALPSTPTTSARWPIAARWISTTSSAWRLTRCASIRTYWRDSNNAGPIF